MSEQSYGENYRGNAAENYERYFVPTIGAPLASDLVEVAALARGERVLDVACGTGLVTRLAAERVGPTGKVAGLDVTSAMLTVARKVTPPELGIDWYETSAEAMPLPDASYDVVLCQMGLQFMSQKVAALREMRRVLVPDGRVALNVPGPTPALFTAMADALARNVAPAAGAFVPVVFSLHDPDQLREMFVQAGLRDVTARAAKRTLQLPAPEEFLWQYIHSTPLVNALDHADSSQRSALERDVVRAWQPFANAKGMELAVSITTVTARR